MTLCLDRMHRDSWEDLCLEFGNPATDNMLFLRCRQQLLLWTKLLVEPVQQPLTPLCIKEYFHTVSSPTKQERSR